MIKIVCLGGLLAVCAGSVFAAASSVSSPDSLVSVLAGACLLAVGLFGRRKRVVSR